jgi:hypothetical protein
MHYHCAYLTAELGRCTTAVLSPVNSQRKDPTKYGKTFCSATSVMQSDAQFWCPNLEDATRIPDGISGATVYPGSTDVHIWNMTDTGGNRIEEGYYLVNAVFTAERAPRTMEGDTMLNNVAVVNLETCWDDPYFDTLGHHRVVNLFHFKDSSFVKVDSDEKKWKGDPFDYLGGPVTFNYKAGTTVESGLIREPGVFTLRAFPNPFRQSIQFRINLLVSSKGCPGCMLKIYDIRGNLIRQFPIAESGTLTWNRQDESGNVAAKGLYILQVKTGTGIRTARIILD